MKIVHYEISRLINKFVIWTSNVDTLFTVQQLESVVQFLSFSDSIGLLPEVQPAKNSNSFNSKIVKHSTKFDPTLLLRLLFYQKKKNSNERLWYIDSLVGYYLIAKAHYWR